MKISELFLKEANSKDIDLSNKKLTSLKQLNIPNIVNGGFYCSNNKLKSLQYGPTEVKGDFYCNNNQLTSLQYCPSKIDGNFYCASNQLTSLQYYPSEVKGGFYCNNNHLTSLQYCPTEVKGGFYCDNNQLTSLQYCPSKIDGNFYCNNNKLKSLQYCPSKVDGHFNCYDNQLTTLKDIHKLFSNDGYIKGYIAFCNNPIKSHILGLILIPELKGISQIETIKDKQLKLACTIINKHLEEGSNRDVFACQEELIDNNLKGFAEL